MKKIMYTSFIAVIFFVAYLLFGFYGNILEYAEIGYTAAYFTDLTAKISLYVTSFFIFASIFFANKFFARKNFEKVGLKYDYEEKKSYINILTIAASVICAFVIGNINYETVLMFFNKTSFGELDVIFGKDISFYVFSLPFYKLILKVLVSAFVAGTIYTALLYYTISPDKDLRNSYIKDYFLSHLFSDGIILVAAWASLLFIKRYDILFGSFSSDITGAGATADNCMKLFYTVAPFIFLIISVTAMIFLRKRDKKKFIGSLAVIPALLIIFYAITFLYQGFYVKPREVTVESEYINYNIEATKKAYNIDNIEERTFDISYDLTREDIKNNSSIIDNIRITDNTANLTVANALQATRGYYSFKDMDILPYEINGKKTGISTAAREFDLKEFDENSRSYINTKMRYTHGYGVVMSKINTVTKEGQPDYLVKDVPLNVTEDELAISRPQIYYGELTDNYVVVGTEYPELDYIMDGQTVETKYNGKGGVELNFLNRLYYSVKNGDMMLLVSGYVNSDSRLLLNRNIVDRARKIAPYLIFDTDPYMIIDDEGNLKWIIDAYTVTDKYPYSQQYGSINYIRNSVKAVVDAYDGTLSFYVTDESDPLALTYSKIYPSVFKREPLPKDIASHIKYPEAIFKIQMDIYGKYHVSDPETFYSKSDVWVTAQEKYNNSEEKDVEPYYNVMKLSENGEDDMVLMLPFIPLAKQNLIAWVGASSNYSSYGDMVVYKFPEGSPVNGTLQIENLISSDPAISEQITLWDQGDSNVMKGNLLVIPIENSIIYVEPLYITSGASSSIPQVKRIIVAYGDKVVMESTLDEAFLKLFGEELNPSGDTEELVYQEGNPDIDKIRSLFNDVKKSMENGDWINFGKNMDSLEEALR